MEILIQNVSYITLPMVIMWAIGGVLVGKVMNPFSGTKINPVIGAAGISAFPMSAWVVHKLGQEEDN